MEAQPNNNYKGYRFVSLDNSPCHIFNNLTCADGEHFAFLTVEESGPMVQICQKDFIDKAESQ